MIITAPGFKPKYPKTTWYRPNIKTSTGFWHAYTEIQIERALELAQVLAQAYRLKDIVGHDDIAPGRKNDPGPAFLRFFFISEAYSDNGAQQQQGTDISLGIKLKAPSYYIILEKEAARAEAEKKAETLRNHVPEATAVQTNDGRYFVIAKPTPVPRSNAVLDAIALKKRLGDRATFELLEAQ